MIQISAFEWIGTNQATIEWNPVTTISGDDPIPAGDTIKYRIYTKTEPGGIETFIGETDKLTYTITFSTEGRYVAGVRAVRVPKDQSMETLSPYTWSNSTDRKAVPVPFGLEYYLNPSEVNGLLVK